MTGMVENQTGGAALKIPTPNECLDMLARHDLPSGRVDHCRKVAEVAHRLAPALTGRGVKVDPDLVLAGALLHDIGKSRARRNTQPKRSSARGPVRPTPRWARSCWARWD